MKSLQLCGNTLAIAPYTRSELSMSELDSDQAQEFQQRRADELPGIVTLLLGATAAKGLYFNGDSKHYTILDQ